MQIVGQTMELDKTKTFPENWDSKAPSVGTLLAHFETTAEIQLRIEFCETVNKFELKFPQLSRVKRNWGISIFKKIFNNIWDYFKFGLITTLH